MSIAVRYYTESHNTEKLCKGEFLRFHKGKPDANDIAACADWAKKTF